MPAWIMIGAGPHLGLPPGWIMIGAGPRLGLGHRQTQPIAALVLALDEVRLHPGGSDHDPSGRLYTHVHMRCANVASRWRVFRTATAEPSHEGSVVRGEGMHWQVQLQLLQ